jgi:hypothetical protein
MGLRFVWESPFYQKVILAFLLLLCLAMLPFGRSGPDDGGGPLAPLAVDSGARWLFRLKPATDFFSVYDAGARAMQGRDPYGVNNDTGGPGARAPYVATYRYLPITSYWLAVPLNALPPWPSYYAWVGFEFSLLIIGFLRCTGRRPHMLPLFALIWFAWFPVIPELHMGQFTIFMAALMLWGLDSFFAGSRSGGTGWAFAVFLKVYPIAMAPSLFLWGKRALTITVAVIVFGTTLLWHLFVPSDIAEGLGRRGIGDRIIGQMRTPYAGAQGVQEMVNSIVWKASGYSFGDELQAAPRPLADPVFVANAGILAAFALLCLWALIETRRTPSVAAIGLFWLAWFYAYVDCWEHHYVLLQALLGLLLARGVIGWRTAIPCYLFAGGPSLWWLWQRTGYSGNNVTEMIGSAYFIQRPLAVLLLTIVLAVQIHRESSEAD